MEEYLIEHCSPTLASLKTANLFTLYFDSEKNWREQLEEWNAALKGRGVELTVLKKTEKSALIYVYRRSKLERDLRADGVAAFLKRCGYEDISAEGAVKTLKSRFESFSEFPHEIGLFLGYPLEDVEGFIKNGGRNSKCCGCWKVYCNECEKIKLFSKFKKCSEVYRRLWSEGRSVLQLTVAA